MGNPFGNAEIMQTCATAFAQAVTLVNLAQQQTAAIGGDSATLKIDDNFLGKKGFQKEVVCDRLFP